MHGQNHIKKRDDQFATVKLLFGSQQGDHKLYIWFLVNNQVDALILINYFIYLFQNNGNITTPH
jgi:hypothetical protein